MTNAFDNPELYESIRLAGVTSPGVVTLTGHDRDHGWDVKKGPGQSGASTERTSEDPIEFECSFFLVRDLTRGIDQIAQWPAFLAVARSSISGPEPKALDVYHPDLASNDIKSVVLRKVLGVTRPPTGGEIRKIRFLEYRPAKKKGGAPSGSKAKKLDPKKPDPDQAALDELDRLINEYKKT